MASASGGGSVTGLITNSSVGHPTPEKYHIILSDYLILSYHRLSRHFSTDEFLKNPKDQCQTEFQ